jgi:radical SAM superfamily enzyme YgiQ (UPF0313 family)
MRVLLINPPQFIEPLDNSPAVISKGRGHNPPLGLLYIAAYLQANTDHEVQVLDAQFDQDPEAGLRNRVREFDPDMIGMTAMTMTLLDVIAAVKIVKSVKEGVRVALGGPHVNIFPTETLELGNIDFVVVGEGEKTFERLLANMDDEQALKKIPGLFFRLNGEIYSTGPSVPLNDLDELPFPARKLVPIKKYTSILAKRDPATTMFTSRGCPFQCAFCDRPHLGKKFRARSAINVVDELEECVNLGIHEFLIYDDTFTVNKKRVIRICDEIERRGLDIGFDVRSRVDTVDEEVIIRLKRAGCQGIHYGVEAGVDRVLKALNKGITIDQVKDTFGFTKRAGLPILAYFMIGNPTETLEDVHATFRLINELAPDYLHLNVLCPFPGTQTYREALERGIIEQDIWREFALNPSSDFEPPIWGERLSRGQLDDLVKTGYRNFYLRPSYVWQRLKKVTSFTEFFKLARGGLEVASLRTGWSMDKGNRC